MFNRLKKIFKIGKSRSIEEKEPAEVLGEIRELLDGQPKRENVYPVLKGVCKVCDTEAMVIPKRGKIIKKQTLCRQCRAVVPLFENFNHNVPAEEFREMKRTVKLRTDKADAEIKYDVEVKELSEEAQKAKDEFEAKVVEAATRGLEFDKKDEDPKGLYFPLEVLKKDESLQVHLKGTCTNCGHVMTVVGKKTNYLNSIKVACSECSTLVKLS